VGVNRAGQNVLFKELADMSISHAEKGYNKDKIHLRILKNPKNE
jgi:hypothetical protein